VLFKLIVTICITLLIKCIRADHISQLIEHEHAYTIRQYV